MINIPELSILSKLFITWTLALNYIKTDLES